MSPLPPLEETDPGAAPFAVEPASMWTALVTDPGATPRRLVLWGPSPEAARAVLAGPGNRRTTFPTWVHVTETGAVVRYSDSSVDLDSLEELVVTTRAAADGASGDVVDLVTELRATTADRDYLRIALREAREQLQAAQLEVIDARTSADLALAALEQLQAAQCEADRPTEASVAEAPAGDRTVVVEHLASVVAVDGARVRVERARPGGRDGWLVAPERADSGPLEVRRLEDAIIHDARSRPRVSSGPAEEYGPTPVDPTVRSFDTEAAAMNAAVDLGAALADVRERLDGTVQDLWDLYLPATGRG